MTDIGPGFDGPFFGTLTGDVNGNATTAGDGLDSAAGTSPLSLSLAAKALTGSISPSQSSVLLGRSSASVGLVEEIPLGRGLEFGGSSKANCLLYDGTTNAIVNFSAAPTLATDNMCVEFVVEFDTTDSAQYIFWIGDFFGAGDGWGVYCAGAVGSLDKFKIYNGMTSITINYNLSPSVPYRVKVFRDSGVWKAWINGVSQSLSSTTLTVTTPSDDFLIGWKLDGKLDEVRVWTANSPTNDILAEVVGDETNLAGAWHCNEGTGSTLADATSGGLDGTLGAGVSWSTIAGQPYAVSELKLADHTVTPTSGDITLGASHEIVLCSAALTVNLPTASGITGRKYNIIRTGSGDVTIDPYSSETISGDSTLVLKFQWSSVVLVSDGTNWVRCS